MGYAMGRGIGAFGGCGCAAPFLVYNNPNGTCGCYCPDNLYTLNDPAAGRQCVSSCPPGTKPSGQPYNWGYPSADPNTSLFLSKSQSCIADPNYVPPGSQINLQTGVVSAVGTPGTPTGPQSTPIATPAPSSPVPPTTPNVLQSSAIPPIVANLPPNISMPASSATSGFSLSGLSSVPWYVWAGAAGVALFAMNSK